MAEGIGQSSGNQVVTIGQTPAYKFLNSDDFKIALRRITGDAEFAAAYDGTIHPDGTRTEGMWDIASRNLARAATGNVHTITPNADPAKVFAATELPELINNPDVTSINGILRDDLSRLKTDLIAAGKSEIEANRILLHTVDEASKIEISHLQIAVGGDGQLAAVGTKEYFSHVALDSAGTDLPVGQSGKYASEFMGAAQTQTHVDALHNAELAHQHLTAYAQERYALATAAGDGARLAEAGKYLNKLGLIGDVIGLMLVAHEANAAYTAGDSAGAQTILSNWAVDFTGGLVAGLAAAQLVGSALSPLYLTGPAGAAIAGGLTLLAGVAGGILGGQLAIELKNIFITDLQSLFHTAEITTSPLILDLDGDGVETISKNASIHFDHDGNRFAENTGWVGKDDGLLVWDRNGNGKIDNGGELFGNNTLLANGSKAPNGFLALAELDSNHDGKVDANDVAFAQLRVWKDGDSNAVVSDGELMTLNAAGGQRLNVAFVTQNQTDSQGNKHLQAGQYVHTNGSARALTDVWFAADTARTIDQVT